MVVSLFLTLSSKGTSIFSWTCLLVLTSSLFRYTCHFFDKLWFSTCRATIGFIYYKRRFGLYCLTTNPINHLPSIFIFPFLFSNKILLNMNGITFWIRLWKNSWFNHIYVYITKTLFQKKHWIKIITVSVEEGHVGYDVKQQPMDVIKMIF